jgi:hypothetical protein
LSYLLCCKEARKKIVQTTSIQSIEARETKTTNT